MAAQGGRPMRRAARRDLNEDPLIELARKLGAIWEQIGPLDGWIHWRGGWVPVEIKDHARKGHADEFTNDQLVFFNRCRLAQAPFWVWYTDEDVLRSLNARRAA